MARQDQRSRRASPGGDLLPAVGRIAFVARASTTRSVGRRPEPQRDEIAAPDSCDWTDSGRSAHCSDADAASFSHQATTVGLLRFGIENFHQRGIPNRGGPTETLQEIRGNSGVEPKSQSRSEKYFQGCCDPSRCRSRPVPRVPRRFSSPRDEANDGAPYPGAKDRGHHPDRLEERSWFRRRTSKTTSSLSVCRESIPDSSRIMTGWFSRRSGSRVSIHNPVRRVLRALSLSRNPMPPRITRKSDRRKASDRTMVGTAQPLCLSALGTDRHRYESTMNQRKRKTHSISFHHWGWTARPFPRGLTVEGEVFVLTYPFIERRHRNVAQTTLPHRDLPLWRACVTIFRTRMDINTRRDHAAMRSDLLRARFHGHALHKLIEFRHK